MSGQVDGSNGHSVHHRPPPSMAANSMPVMTMETMIAANAVPAYALNLAHLPHQQSFVSTAPAAPAVPGCKFIYLTYFCFTISPVCFQ